MYISIYRIILQISFEVDNYAFLRKFIARNVTEVAKLDICTQIPMVRKININKKAIRMLINLLALVFSFNWSSFVLRQLLHEMSVRRIVFLRESRSYWYLCIHNIFFKTRGPIIHILKRSEESIYPVTNRHLTLTQTSEIHEQSILVWCGGISWWMKY